MILLIILVGMEKRQFLVVKLKIENSRKYLYLMSYIEIDLKDEKNFILVIFLLSLFSSNSFANLQFKQSKDISDDTDIFIRGINY